MSPRDPRHLPLAAGGAASSEFRTPVPRRDRRDADSGGRRGADFQAPAGLSAGPEGPAAVAPRLRTEDGMISLLVVSDTGEPVRPFHRHLSAFGCHVESAANGVEALDALSREGYDAVVVAMSRGTNGVAREIVRAVRGAHRDQVVTVLLAENSPERERDLVESGATAVVGAPCTPGEFLTRLMTAMVKA